jgi:hypothetical protein
MPGAAWNNWYHLMANTYGTWLPGDPRGFRTRRHRRHVQGDYRNPPPAGRDVKLHTAARKLMPRPPVYLTSEARRVGLTNIHHALVEHSGIESLAVAVGRAHLHVLGRFGPPDEASSAMADLPRHYLGIAKQWSAKALVKRNLARPGGVWARRGKIKPIENRAHQVRVFDYILAHRKEGAAVWSFREGPPV